MILRGRLVIQFKHTRSVFKHWTYVSKKRKTCLFIHFQHRLLGKHCSKTDFQTQFWNHLRPVFKQQNKGSKWQLGNYLENGKGPPSQVCLISSSHNYPKVSARQIPKSTWSAFLYFRQFFFKCFGSLLIYGPSRSLS